MHIDTHGFKLFHVMLNLKKIIKQYKFTYQVEMSKIKFLPLYWL